MSGDGVPGGRLLARDAARRLVDALRAAGYTPDGVHDLLGAQAHAAFARGERVPALRATAGGGPLATLVRLFLLVEPVPVEQVAEVLDPADAGPLLELDGGRARAAVDLRPYGTETDAWWVVSDLPAADGRIVRADHVLGVGGASANLAQLTVRAPVASALDLGTGCGVQALHLATHATAVTATDVSPRAAAFARTTFDLNGVDPELVVGDLFAPVAGRRFDLLVSNPPFVVGPGPRFSYRDSGLPGDEACRRIVTGAPSYLTESGVAQLLANWLHLRGEDWRERVGGWLAGTGCDAWVLQRDVQDPASYVGLWLADAGEKHDTALYDAWLDALERQGVEGIGFGVVTLRRAGAAPTQVVEEAPQQVEDPLGPHVAGWLDRAAFLRADDDALLTHAFTLAPDAYLEDTSVRGDEGWRVVARRLQTAGGLRWSVEVDEVAAAVLAACDGTRPLGLVLEVAAAVHGVDPAAAVPGLRDLVRRGLLLP